jgi:kynureninase
MSDLFSKNAFTGIASSLLCSEEYARKADEKDDLSHLRKEFIIPTKADLRYKKYGPAPKTTTEGLNGTAHSNDEEESIYMCGNSLGLQPRRTRDYINRYLDTWASKGVFGHFRDLEGGLPPWMHLDDALKEQTSKLVGALASEVVVMETLTANLHLLMSSFYRPTKDRYKIIIEGKAFPSDHVSYSWICLHVRASGLIYNSTQPSPNSPTTISLHPLLSP